VKAKGFSRFWQLTLIRYLAKRRTMNLVFKALADPTRRRVLELLRKGPMTAGDLSDHFSVSKPTMSGHFAVLREAGLVDAHKSGKAVSYRLKLSVLEDALLGFAGAFGMRIRTGPKQRRDGVGLKRGEA
jgi:DNA-binding transcriptional ArsR family regulator